MRIPASYCGVVGLKPTRGLVSGIGVLPFCWSLDEVGLLTRSVRDSAVMLDVIRGGRGTRAPHPERLPPTAAALDDGIQGLRIGVLKRYYFEGDDLRDDVRRHADEALVTLRDLGAILIAVDLPTIDQNDAIYTTLLSEAYAVHAGYLKTTPELYHDWLRIQLYAGALFTADDVLRVRRLQARLVQECLQAFQRVDAFVLPGQSSPATPFGASFKPALTQARTRFTRPWNVTGLPVLAVPCGLSQDALPLSMHFVTAPFEEVTLFRLGRAFDQATPGSRLRPSETLYTFGG